MQLFLLTLNPPPSVAAAAAAPSSVRAEHQRHTHAFCNEMRRMHADVRLIAERCFALTENNPACTSPPADLHHISCHMGRGWRKSFVCKERGKKEEKNAYLRKFLYSKRPRHGNNRNVVVYFQSDKSNFKTPLFLSFLERKIQTQFRFEQVKSWYIFDLCTICEVQANVVVQIVPF